MTLEKNPKAMAADGKSLKESTFGLALFFI
jgi:hypothetical protein